MILTLLLACVGAMKAQPVEGQKYRIKNNKTGLYLEFTSTEKDGVKLKNLDGDNLNQCFYFLPVENVEDTYWIKSEGGRYLQLTDAKTWDMVAIESEPTDDKANITLVAVDNSYYLQTVSTCSWGNNMALNDGASGIDGDIVYADKAKTATYVAWTLEKFVEAVSFTVDYQINGTSVKTLTASAFSGDAYTVTNPSTFTTISSVVSNEQTVNPVDGVYSLTINGDEKIVVNLTETLPFTVSTDVNSATWHKVYMAATTTWCYDTGNNNVTVGSVPETWSSAYMFAFVGNSVTGFQIYNKEIGTSKMLWTTNQIDGTGTQIKATAVAEVMGENWILENGQTGYYAFRRDGVDNAYMNPQGGKLCYWKSASGKTDNNGGRISFVAVSDAELAALAKIDFNEWLATAYALNSTIGSGVGYNVAPVSFAAAYAAAQAITEESSSTEIEKATADLKASIEEGFTLILPEEGKYYTLKNAYSNVYMNVNADGGLISTNNGIGIGEMFQFVPAEDDKFYLKNVERGTFLSTAPGHAGGQASATIIESNGAKAVAIANLGKENRVSLIPVGGTTLHHDANYSTIVGWTGDADSRSAWKIEEVDIKEKSHPVAITDVEWATLMLGYDAIVPEGVTAYAVSSVEGDVAKLTEVEGVVPAGEAVLLNGAKGTYEFKLAESAGAVDGNMLEGSTINSYVTEDAYVLAATNGVGLYKATMNQKEGTAFLNNAFKAYLPAPANAPAPMFSFNRGEGTTGIDKAQLTMDNVVIYDLLGRRVEKMEKGIYIVNGKKIIK